MSYVKKSNTIEAIQFLGGNAPEAMWSEFPLPEWLTSSKQVTFDSMGLPLYTDTPLRPGDWLLCEDGFITGLADVVFKRSHYKIAPMASFELEEPAEVE